jgi:hypothetical protein
MNGTFASELDAYALKSKTIFAPAQAQDDDGVSGAPAASTSGVDHPRPLYSIGADASLSPDNLPCRSNADGERGPGRDIAVFTRVVIPLKDKTIEKETDK